MSIKKYKACRNSKSVAYQLFYYQRRKMKKKTRRRRRRS
jgi:rRNA processing protein Gar1